MTRTAAHISALAAVAIMTTSCSRSGGPPPAQPPAATTTAAPPVHEHKPSHGGTLVEIGDEFAHIEFVLDSSTGKLTAFVLDGEAELAVRLAQPWLTLILAAPPSLANRPLDLRAQSSVLTGEKVGDSSEFVGTFPALQGLDRLQGRIAHIVVRGSEFRNVPFKLLWPTALDAGLDCVESRARRDEQRLPVCAAENEVDGTLRWCDRLDPLAGLVEYLHRASRGQMDVPFRVDCHAIRAELAEQPLPTVQLQQRLLHL